MALRRVLLLAVPLLCAAAPNAFADGGPSQPPSKPLLEARAIYPATKMQPGPSSGNVGVSAANGVTPPFSGQPIPGISGALADRDGGFWGQPDNGFGAKGNSADYLLRNYHFTADWRTARRGSGVLDADRFISYRDPDHKVPFPIVNGSTPDRLLTGADFDIESVQRARDGSLWVGEEFGPYLLHFDATGKLLEAPIPLPGVKSPQSPDLKPGETPNLPGSRGFEAMAMSRDGRTLYPILEGAVADDADKTLRRIYTFDIRSRAYKNGYQQMHVDDPGFMVGDAQVLRDGELVVIERDGGQGPTAKVKRLVGVDLSAAPAADGTQPRRLIADMLNIADPFGISTATGPAGGFGIGDPFSFPVQSFETVTLLGGDHVLIANDNNFPFDASRVPGKPDDLEAAIVRIPGLKGLGHDDGDNDND
jgi:hypothetical protein